jgi:hypothetical protein
VSHCFVLEAQSEYLQAIEFYEEQREGLGAALIAEFERVVEIAATAPETWKTVHPVGIRRINLTRFP